MKIDCARCGESIRRGEVRIAEVNITGTGIFTAYFHPSCYRRLVRRGFIKEEEESARWIWQKERVIEKKKKGGEENGKGKLVRDD